MRLSQIVNLGASKSGRPAGHILSYLCFIMCCMLIRIKVEKVVKCTPVGRGTGDGEAGPGAALPAPGARAGAGGRRWQRCVGGIGLISPIGPSREIVLPCPTRYQTAYYKTTHPDLGLIAPGFFGGRGATSRASEVAL